MSDNKKQGIPDGLGTSIAVFTIYTIVMAGVLIESVIYRIAGRGISGKKKKEEKDSTWVSK